MIVLLGHPGKKCAARRLLRGDTFTTPDIYLCNSFDRQLAGTMAFAELRDGAAPTLDDRLQRAWPYDAHVGAKACREPARP